MTGTKPFPEAPDNSTLHEARPGENGHLLERIQSIAKSLDTPAPKVWIANSTSLQAEAFPSGNIAVTTATLELLSEKEQNAFLAHELGHLKNGDQNGYLGGLQVLGQAFKGHLQEHREMMADTRSVEAAYASHLYSPDDLSNALRKLTIAGKTAGHDNSALDGSLSIEASGALMNALPNHVREKVNVINDNWNQFWGDLHLNTHPTLEHRIEYINELKLAHDKGGVKR